MVEQYPDSIIITVKIPAVQNESTGLWTEGSSTPYTFQCRAEVNGTGKQIPGNDGSLMDYAFQVYLPLMSTVIPTGSDYVLTAFSNGTISGKVKRASNGQLNSRLWL
jgi:hypothetical protein